MKILAALMIVTAAGSLYYSFSHLKSTPKPASNIQNSEETGQSNSQTAENLATNTGGATASYVLKIDKLGLQVPIILDVDGNNKEQYMKALEGGVAQMAKTALPGNSGNTVLFGHSSYYRNKPGSYKTIFAKLSNLSSGDKIVIASNDKTLTYNINEVKTVSPSDVSVVNQNSSGSKLTLITCWPPQTTNERLVVAADLIK